MSPTAGGVLPGALAPVDVRCVLAYSCAAARELHPLPIAPALEPAYDRANPGLERAKKLGLVNLRGRGKQVNRLLAHDGLKSMSVTAICRQHSPLSIGKRMFRAMWSEGHHRTSKV